MAVQLKFPERFAHLKIEGVAYAPDKDGYVNVTKPSHVCILVSMGAVDDSKVRRVAPVAPPKSVTPPVGPDIAADVPDVSVTPSDAPDESQTKAALVGWLADRGVAVPGNISKKAVWDIVQETLNAGE